MSIVSPYRTLHINAPIYPSLPLSRSLSLFSLSVCLSLCLSLCLSVSLALSFSPAFALKTETLSGGFPGHGQLNETTKTPVGETAMWEYDTEFSIGEPQVQLDFCDESLKTEKGEKAIHIPWYNLLPRAFYVIHLVVFSCDLY